MSTVPARSKTRKPRPPRRSLLAGLLKAGCWFHPLRSTLIHAACGLEGGQMWSATFRECMLRYYGVKIGLHSYGPSLFPGRLPRGTEVGNYCSFASGLQVSRRDHPLDRISQHPFFFNASAGVMERDSIPAVEDNPLVIGHDVWIGQNVLISSSCRNIGNSAVIAAGAVVTTDVPPFAIVGGVPARIIRFRLSEDLRKAWLASQWWLKPASELTRQLDLFLRPFDDREMLAEFSVKPLA